MHIKIPSVVEATAAVKGPEHYQWFTYNHKAPFPMLLRNNVVTLALGDQFGVRPGTGGTTRLVLGQDVSKVLSITAAEQALLTERATANKGKGAKPKARPANKAVQGQDIPEGTDAVTFWNKDIVPLLRELRVKVGLISVPEKSVSDLVASLPLGRLGDIDGLKPSQQTKILVALRDAVGRKLYGQRTPMRPNPMQMAGLQVLNSAKKNRNFVPTSFKASSADEIDAFVRGLSDLCDHFMLAHYLFMGNKAKAERASHMDTSSRDEIPNKAWDYIQENLR